MLKRLRGLPRQEGGFILPAVIVLLAVGTLVLMPWLDFLSGSIRNANEDVIADEAYYAADGGVQAVLKDLLIGADPLAGGYSTPAVTLNGFDVSIVVASLPASARLPFDPVLVNPDSTGALASVGPGDSVTFTFKDVLRNTPVQINWAFTQPGSWDIALFDGANAQGEPVFESSGTGALASVVVPADLIAGGVYTIRFRAKSGSTLVTVPFSETADPNATWLRLIAFRDYLVTSQAGNVTLQVLVRQGPASTIDRRTVQVTAWDAGS